MVQEIGRRTRLKNRDVQLMLETEVVAQPDTSQLKRFRTTSRLGYRRIRLRVSKHLKRRLNSELSIDD
jgi:hypothetical protein